MWVNPQDPTLPWRKEVAGSPFVLAGSQMTFLGSSDYWSNQASTETQDQVNTLLANINGAACVESALSIEVFTSLLSRFTEPGFTVLAAWDPCGVVQAASIVLGLPSICFLGLSSKTTVDSGSVPDMPLLGYKSVDVKSTLQIVILDHKGSVRPRSESPLKKQRGST